RLRLHVAHGRAYLVVGIAGDIFHQKIDQAGVALEDRKNLHGAVGGSGLSLGSGRGFGRYEFGVAERLRDIRGKRPTEQDGEEAAECERNSAQDGSSWRWRKRHFHFRIRDSPRVSAFRPACVFTISANAETRRLSHVARGT